MNTGIKKIGLSLGIMLLTVACSFQPITQQPQVIDVSPTQIVIPGQLEEIIEYYHFILNENKVTVRQEFEKIRENFNDNPNNANRLKYALLLATPDTPFQNRNHAIKLLNNWPQPDQTEPSLYNLGNLLLTFLTEQQKTNNKINNLSRQLKNEQERVKTLQKIVRDIKDMEKNLFRRNLN